MTTRPRHVPIQRKLVGIIMLTSSVALLLACSGFVAYEVVAQRKAISRQLDTLARVVGDTSAAALARDDRHAAHEVLAALHAEPDLVSACIYTRDGRPFAAFLRGESRRDLPRLPGEEGAVFENYQLVLFRRMLLKGQPVGTIYLKRDLRDERARLERYGGIVLGVMLASALAALLLSSRLQRVISEPILRLAATAARVTREKDYSLRATREGVDEIDVLVNSFNDMLGQIHARAQALHQADQQLQRHVAELCDEIARRQHVQEELESARQTAEASSRAKSAFLANMSHELRTPLNAIIGYSEMMCEDARESGDTRPIQDLERITAAGKHLLTLINAVLDLSKVEAGKTELIWETVSVARLLEDAVQTMAPLAARNGNQLVARCAPDAGEMRVDVVKCRQSLYNLLSNACKFTQNGTVSVEVEPVDREGVQAIEWRIRDTGVGIQPGQVSRLFQPFSQGDASTTRKYGGTGLGLAISQRFCQLMGGGITVDSEPGRGSTFTIRLPRGAPPETDQPEPPAVLAPEPETAAGAARGRKSATVLVIDDDPTVHDLLRRSLARRGFHVAVASGGEEGLRKAREIHPAAITLDVFMPGMDGWSVLNALKSDPDLAAVPVILLTISDDHRRACLLGAAGFLQKPVQPERLLAVLQPYREPGRTGPVLIVDDDGGSREWASRVLRKQFGEVVEAADGAEALALMEHQTPAMIVADLMMPGMDGFDFIAAVRRVDHWRHIPIVVLTAREIDAGDRQRLAGSVRRIFQKSALDGVTLAGEIADLLKGSREDTQTVPVRQTH